MTKLIALRRSTNGEILPIHKRLTFGRDGSCCDSVLTHPSAARRHFQVFVERGQAFVTDLSGPRGTFVNNIKVTEDTPHPIRNGDRLLYGESQNELFSVAEIDGGNEKIDKLTKKLEWLVTECERIRAKEGAEGLNANQQRTLDRYQEDIAEIGKSLGTLLSATSGETSETGGETEDAFWDGGVPEDNGIDSGYLDLTEKKTKATKSVETYDTLVKKLNDLDAEKLTLEQEIAKLKQATNNQTTEDDADELDKFMAANEKDIQTSDLEKAEKRLAEVLEERKRTQALVNIAQPALARMTQPVVNKDVSAKPQSTGSLSEVSSISKEPEVKPAEVSKGVPASTSTATSLFSRGTSNSKSTSAAAFRVIQNPLDKRAKVEFSDELAGESEQVKANGEASETTSTWVPPSNQQGDGRTKANSKYGY